MSVHIHCIPPGRRSRDFTDPLRSYERPAPTSPLKTLLHWLAHSLHPFMPPGTRHNALPITGILARNRVLALKEAEIRLALAEFKEEDVSVRGAAEASRMLQQQSSLRKRPGGSGVERGNSTVKRKLGICLYLYSHDMYLLVLALQYVNLHFISNLSFSKQHVDYTTSLTSCQSCCPAKYSQLPSMRWKWLRSVKLCVCHPCAR
jgi:hypothetical protein